MSKTDKPKAYVWRDTDTGMMYLSAYPQDHDLWENNHVVLAEMGRGRINRHEGSMNILTNVLRDIGVDICEE